MKQVYLYKRFERFWHWAQAALIFLLFLSGFEVHGSYSLFGYKSAVSIHNSAAIMLLILIAFAIFWHFTTGEWRQYVPTTDKLKEQIQFYLSGMFKGEPHPHHKTELSKLNPLQRLTYLAFKLVLIPIMVLSGWVYFCFGCDWLPSSMLKPIGTVHAFGAFLMLAFVIVHVYMTTTGTTVFSNLKAMITGYEDVEEDH